MPKVATITGASLLDNQLWRGTGGRGADELLQASRPAPRELTEALARPVAQLRNRESRNCPSWRTLLGHEPRVPQGVTRVPRAHVRSIAGDRCAGSSLRIRSTSSRWKSRTPRARSGPADRTSRSATPSPQLRLRSRRHHRQRQLAAAACDVSTDLVGLDVLIRRSPDMSTPLQHAVPPQGLHAGYEQRRSRRNRCGAAECDAGFAR